MDSQPHVRHPGTPLLRADFEALVGFTETQPPPELRIVAGAAEKVNEECGESLNCAFERFAGKQGPEYRIARNTGIECSRESAASRCTSNGLIQIGPSHFRHFPTGGQEAI